MNKRILSAVLTIVMLLSLMPTVAFAADSDYSKTVATNGVAKIVWARLGSPTTNADTESSKLTSDYGVKIDKVSSDNKTVEVTLKAKDLKIHKTGTGDDNLNGYWAGIGVKVTDGNTYTYGF